MLLMGVILLLEWTRDSRRTAKSEWTEIHQVDDQLR